MRVTRVIALTGVSVAVLLGIAQRDVAQNVQGGQSPNQPVVTASGRLLEEFEALLRQTFPGPTVGARKTRDWINFYCSTNCGPLSAFSPYWYVLTNPRPGLLRLTTKDVKKLDFGNYPAPVLIHGRGIACNTNDTAFLITYREAASLTLACAKPLR